MVNCPRVQNREADCTRMGADWKGKNTSGMTSATQSPALKGVML